MENFNLDARQLARIEAVHRGFLYQHLYAAAERQGAKKRATGLRTRTG